MPKFRKKPVVVDAEQFKKDAKLPFAAKRACNLGPNGWYVVTIHGQETAIANGDWIIAEPDGEHFYPCKPDIFAATYEPATDYPPSQGCEIPPAGWYCTREKGHEGPCAALPTTWTANKDAEGNVI